MSEPESEVRRVELAGISIPFGTLVNLVLKLFLASLAVLIPVAVVVWVVWETLQGH